MSDAGDRLRPWWSAFDALEAAALVLASLLLAVLLVERFYPALAALRERLSAAL